MNAVQQEAAALARRIPLVLVPSLRLQDILLALRPVLVDRGLVADAAQGRQVSKASWD